MSNIGKIVQVIGPVVDIRFEEGHLPKLNNAIEIDNAGSRLVVEVAQHMGDDVVRCVAMDSTDGLKRGQDCVDTGAPIKVPVGKVTLGRMVNVLGEPIDGMGPIEVEGYRPIEFKAPGVMARKGVCEPVQTGLLAIDAMIPIGRGQRELIIGDRKTGKTAVGIDTIINQKNENMICVYVAVGQKASTVAAIRETLEKHGALEYSIIVSASASDAAPLQFIAPMAGAAIGEYFMYNGKDGKPAGKDNPGGHVLCVYDDLSKQAVAYRQMSLTLDRPPGREAYPGDIFYLHSRLLERAARLDDKYGGGSITALPIIETMSGNISSYIPTNVISITDGQIYLETELFHNDIRPAVNTGLSVSRVGRSAQPNAMQKVSKSLRIDLAQYREMSVFARFGADLDPSTMQMLDRGRKLTLLFVQGKDMTYSLSEKVVLLRAFRKHVFDSVKPEQMNAAAKSVLSYMKKNYADLLYTVESTTELNDGCKARLDAALAAWKM